MRTIFSFFSPKGAAAVMEPESPQDRLTDIPTQWSVVVRAHQDTPEAASATQQLLERYRRPIYRYLLACVRRLDVADELFQEFALRFVRGDFKNADPGRGRFRCYLKTVLHHLVVDFQRKQQRESHQPLPAAEAAPASGPPAAPEEDLTGAWREDLMARAWEELAQWERQKQQPLYSVLRFRADHPDLKAAPMAERLSAQLGTAVSAEWVYKKLHQAREKFTDLIVEEVAQTLDEPTVQNLEQELLDLGLLDFCQAALQRRGTR
jgi:RNA polymerase sigma-70 factor (ECF subfamily)